MILKFAILIETSADGFRKHPRSSVHANQHLESIGFGNQRLPTCNRVGDSERPARAFAYLSADRQEIVVAGGQPISAARLQDGHEVAVGLHLPIIDSARAAEFAARQLEPDEIGRMV